MCSLHEPPPQAVVPFPHNSISEKEPGISFQQTSGVSVPGHGVGVVLTAAGEVELAKRVRWEASLVEQVVDGKDAASAQVDTVRAILGCKHDWDQAGVPVIGHKDHILAINFAIDGDLQVSPSAQPLVLADGVSWSEIWHPFKWRGLPIQALHGACRPGTAWRMQVCSRCVKCQ